MVVAVFPGIFAALLVTVADFAGPTTTVNLLDVIAPIESITCIVNKYDPATVGVPRMSPVAAVNFRPLGSCPVVRLQVYGGVPPLAISRHEYTTCTPPLGSVAAVVIWMGIELLAAPEAAITTSVKFVEAVAPAESFTCTVNENVPATVGVPKMSPVVAVSVNPLGSCPAVKLQVYGAVPPLAITRHEYTTCTPPLGSLAAVVI